MPKGVGKKTGGFTMWKYFFLCLGIIGMSFSATGVFLTGGSLLQKIFFLIGPVLLTFFAVYNKQKMFIALQVTVLVGAILGFFGDMEVIYKYVFMGLVTIISLGYLLKEKYFKNDMWGIVGAIGLISIALGLAVNAAEFPMLFNVLLAVGGLSVAIYSAIGFFVYKVRITMLWLILNIVFAIGPIKFIIENSLL